MTVWIPASPAGGTYTRWTDGRQASVGVADSVSQRGYAEIFHESAIILGLEDAVAPGTRSRDPSARHHRLEGGISVCVHVNSPRTANGLLFTVVRPRKDGMLTNHRKGA